MQGMLIIRWTQPKSGHEIEAMRLADHSNAFFTRMKDEGMVEGHEWVSNFTGSDGGMFLIRGAPEKLAAISTMDEFGEIHLRGLLHLEHWHWDMGLSGVTVDEVYPHYRELVGA